MNLYDQLCRLQEIPDAFNRWESYRQALTTYLMVHAYGSREIALFGAGRCQDIDLKMLTTYFERVYLFDKDEKAMEKAVQKYDLTAYPRISCEVMEFTGITEADYRRYADLLINEIRRDGHRVKTERLVERAMTLLEEMEEKIRCDAPCLGSFDNTVAVGVHSQLISMLEWIWTVLLQLLNREEDGVRAFIGSLNEKVTEQFNGALLKATQHHCLIGCELAKVGEEGAIQGAVQGLRNMERRRTQGQIVCLDEATLIWPFHPAEHKTYLMQLQTFKKR